MRSKIGIFGGTFDPIHEGHINSIKTIQTLFNLDKVHVVPNYQSPFKKKPQLSAIKRLNLIKTAFDKFNKIVIDEQEIQRKGISYSVNTIKKIKSDYPHSELFFILGVDVFQTFHKWHQFEQILNLVHLIVTSRPGWPFIQNKKDIPTTLQKLIKTYDKKKRIVWLETQKKIFFVPLKNIPASSTKIRAKNIKNS